MTTTHRTTTSPSIPDTPNGTIPNCAAGKSAWHHGRHRRLAAVVVIAAAAFAGVHSAASTHPAGSRAELMNHSTTVARPEATTDWLARTNR